jgi:IS5 family transposase
LAHHPEVASANERDVTAVPKLLYGEEETVRGDSGYPGAKKREDAAAHNKNGRKIKYSTNHEPSQSKRSSKRPQAQIKRKEREKSPVREKAEHVSGVVKGLSGYQKTRYKGLRKQTAKLNMMFAPANLYLADKRFGLAV